MDPHDQINHLYLTCLADSTPLFQAILDLSADIGLLPALKILEDCVTEKRLAWVAEKGSRIPHTGNALQDGFDLFYTHYLGASIPEQGEIIQADETRIVSRWWNPCTTLDACQQLGLDTCLICREVYQRPVQAMLQQLNPRLRFGRNYAHIRPYTPYCEEIITLSPV